MEKRLRRLSGDSGITPVAPCTDRHPLAEVTRRTFRRQVLEEHEREITTEREAHVAAIKDAEARRSKGVGPITRNRNRRGRGGSRRVVGLAGRGFA